MNSITCDEALELISARLDGALSPDGEAALEAHLAQCPACGALLADLEEIHAALDGAEEVPPPADLKDKIMAAVAREQVVPLPAPKKRSPNWRAWGSIAAVLALALLGGGLLHSTGSAGGTNAAPMAAGGAAPRGVYSAPAPAGSCAPEAAAQVADPSEAVTEDAGSGQAQPELGGAMPTPAPVPAPSPQSEGQDTVVAPFTTTKRITADTLPGTVCGVLTLPSQDAPALDAYFSAQAEDGLHYYLPAADFQALAGGYDGAALDESGEGIDPEAEYGLVILTP